MGDKREGAGPGGVGQGGDVGHDGVGQGDGVGQEDVVQGADVGVGGVGGKLLHDLVLEVAVLQLLHVIGVGGGVDRVLEPGG